MNNIVIRQYLNKSTYYDKIYGGFYGKVIGSYFGMPLELKPYHYIQRRWGEINDYVKIYKRDVINDDEMYEIAGLMALEKYGIDLTSRNIADMWLEELYTNMFTAEFAAYQNLKEGIYPPDSGIKNNIYSDFIGAQMRGELWGLIAPGSPDIAGEYAKKDAIITHSGEGVLGEIFISRIVSAAFFETNPRKLIEIAVKKIPENSLYMTFINKTIKLHDDHSDWRSARRKIIDYWKEIRKKLIDESSDEKRRDLLEAPGLHQVHVLPNIGIIIIALLYGNGNFGRTVCIAGMCAYDTDCNCGNVGAIIGTSIGESKISEKWKRTINNIFKTKLKSFRESKISELADRISKIGEKVIKTKIKELVYK